MLFRTPRPTRATVLVAALGVAAVVALAGCTSTTDTDPSVITGTPSTATTAAPTSTSTPTATLPAGLDPSTPAALTKFTSTVQSLVASNPSAKGEDVVDALVTAGFDKKAMEVTPDTTTIGRAVDSIEFSVLWKNTSCLIGQIGSQGVSTTASPVLSTGKCLIGTTRTIDW